MEVVYTNTVEDYQALALHLLKTQPGRLRRGIELIILTSLLGVLLGFWFWLQDGQVPLMLIFVWPFVIGFFALWNWVLLPVFTRLLTAVNCWSEKIY